MVDCRGKKPYETAPVALQFFPHYWQAKISLSPKHHFGPRILINYALYVFGRKLLDNIMFQYYVPKVLLSNNCNQTRVLFQNPCTFAQN